MSYNLKIFEEDINLELYYQFKRMLLNLTQKDSHDCIFTGILGYIPPEKELHGMRYPGEVLEQYKEKGFDDDRSRRALLIALTECLELLDSTMFNTNQLSSFLNETRSLAEKDIYILCAMLKWEDDVDRRLQLCGKITAVQECTDAILLYIASMTREYDSCWENFEAKIAYMFLMHKICVFENVGVIDWLLRAYAQEIAASRKSCARVLKIFTKLKNHRLSQESKEYKYLESLGYTEQEIIYLNVQLSQNCNGDCLCSVLVSQNIVVAACKVFITAEQVEHPEVLDTCETCLRKHNNLARGIKGEKSLTKVLADIRIGSVEMFKRLYKLKGAMLVPDDWFCVDVLDDKWDVLYDFMGKNQYGAVFEQVLYSDMSNVDRYVQKYKCITGGDYVDDALSDSTSLCIAQTEIWVQKAYINMYELIDKCAIEDCVPNSTQQCVLKFLRGTHSQICDYWRYIVNKYGLDTLHKLVGKNDFISEVIRKIKINQSDTFLPDMETDRIEMFEWACHEVCTHTPDDYIYWVAEVLLSEYGKALPKEYTHVIYSVLIEDEDLRYYQRVQLLKEYGDAGEYERFIEQQEAEKQKKKEQEKKENIERWRGVIQENIQSDNIVESLLSTGDSSSRYAEGYMAAWLQVLKERLSSIIFTQEQADKMYKLLCSAVDSSDVDLDSSSFINILGEMEVAV